MPQPLLKRLDQLALAALTLLAMLSLVGWLALRWLGGDSLVEIDHAAPLHYEFLVDVNTAEWPELAQLPGIGEVLAKRIVDTRVKEGPYQTEGDLMRVNGIGVRKLASLRRHLLPLPEQEMVAER